MLGLLLGIGGARICPECADADFSQHNCSWYRRSHHLPGIDWCRAHRVPLLGVVASAPFNSAPIYWRKQGKVTPLVSTSPYELNQDAFVSRYMAVLLALLWRDRPLVDEDLNKHLAAVNDSRAGRNTSTSRSEDVLAYISRRAPIVWLQANFQELFGSIPPVYERNVELVLSGRKQAMSAAHYGLLIAALVDSPDAAAAFVDSSE